MVYRVRDGRNVLIYKGLGLGVAIAVTPYMISRYEKTPKSTRLMGAERLAIEHKAFLSFSKRDRKPERFRSVSPRSPPYDIALPFYPD